VSYCCHHHCHYLKQQQQQQQQQHLALALALGWAGQAHSLVSAQLVNKPLGTHLLSIATSLLTAPVVV
jgi:hypothetical protein